MSDKYPWQKREAERTALRKVKVKKPPTPIARVGKKLAREEGKHAPIKKKFLTENPMCQCCRPGCQRWAVDIHHMKGRGVWLNVVKYFLAVCRSCHDWIGDHDAEAKALGYSISRLTK